MPQPRPSFWNRGLSHPDLVLSLQSGVINLRMETGKKLLSDQQNQMAVSNHCSLPAILPLALHTIQTKHWLRLEMIRAGDHSADQNLCFYNRVYSWANYKVETKVSSAPQDLWDNLAAG
jgi:hypothetical protein